MMIQLRKPLIFFDLETTGTDITKDRIVEIYAVKFFPNGSEEEYYSRVNPGIPVPKSASKIHGLTDELLASEPTLLQLKQSLLSFFSQADLAGYNVLKFDLPLLVEECLRIGIEDIFDESHIVDSMLIFHKMVPRNLAGALRYYKNKELVNAHSAKADVLATVEIFKAQLERHKELPNDPSKIQDFTLNNQDFADFAGFFKRDMSGDIVFNFGKHKGKKAQEEKDYLQWMLQSDFPAQTKRLIKKILEPKNDPTIPHSSNNQLTLEL